MKWWTFKKIFLVILLAFLIAPLALHAQEEKKDDANKDSNEVQAGEADSGSGGNDADKGDESVNESFATSASEVWNPPNRREPFSNPVQKAKQGGEGDARIITKSGRRPPGIQGMELKEIELVGILLVKGVYKAMFVGSDDFAYLLIADDEIWDSKVKEIDMNCVTFEQETEDLRFRVRRIKTVRKCLSTD